MNLNHLIKLPTTLRELKLSPLQVACLILMQKNEQRGFPLHHLATRMGVSVSGAKVSLSKLEKQGYLKPRPKRGINAVKLYEVTEAGVGALIQLENL